MTTKQDIYSLVALRLVQNVESDVLIDSDTKAQRKATFKNQEKARERLLEEVNYTQDELEIIKSNREKKRQKFFKMQEMATKMNEAAAKKVAFSNKPKIKMPNKK